ncbi:MAG: AEC family transporter [Candidatus Dadabacteria bacterium]|nr:MAG: AEC family transporter [Candidatus Dadabacteria bacterium]
MPLLLTAAEICLPVAVCIAAGWTLARRTGLSAAPLAGAAVHVFGPALLLANVPPNLAARPMLPVVLLGTVGLTGLAAHAAGRLLKLRDRTERVSLLLGAMLCNFGFFGIPIVEAALGSDARAQALAVLVILNIPTGFLSAWFASPNPQFAMAMRHTLSSPFNWAIVASIAMSLMGWSLPSLVQPAADLLAGGAIPAGLVVLGMELARLGPSPQQRRIVATAVGLRLLVGPLIAWALALLTGLWREPAWAQSAILQMATPAGITPLIFLAASGQRSTALAAVVFWSTIVSLATVPLFAIALRLASS